ncbi:MAG: glycosyltransferase [Acidisphaera sp.]|nr:glycosyltransferase [Acidisphaera sp.]
MFADLVLGLAAFPLVMVLLNLPAYRTPARATGRPAVSVLIPARNEERNIGPACAAVLASDGVDLELIVLDDHSADATAEIVRGIADSRVTLAGAPPLPAGWSGKQHACMQLSRLARHDLLLFVDADVRLARDALSRMAGYMHRHDVALASGFPRQLVGSWAERLLLPLIHFLLLGYLPLAAMRRSSAPALGAGCGQLMMVRRDAYDRIGGHAAVRASLHDGIMLPRAFRRAGMMTGLFDASRFARCRMYRDAREVWEGLGKNATEGMATPVALPVWTVLLGVGHVLPLFGVMVWPSVETGLALGASLGARLLLALRFRQPVLSALLHPAGVATLLALQWTALARAMRGRPAIWRGRAYPAP